MITAFCRTLALGSILGSSLVAFASAQATTADEALLRVARDAAVERSYEALWHVPGVAGPDGAWIARNREHGFCTVFGSAEVAVEARLGAAPWRLELALESWGRIGELHAAGPASLEISGGWIEYRREQLVEWYRNDASGLEQGFTLLAPPLTRADAPRGEVELRLRIAGDLRAELVGEPGSLALHDACGDRALSYSGLRAWDARGEPLACRFALESDFVSILVSDANASYPITIDPLIASLEQKISPGGTIGLGFSVDIDGDTAVALGTGTCGLYGCNYAVAVVLARSGSTWTEQTRLYQNDGTVYGGDVALDGDRLIFSIYAGNNSIATYVRTGTSWTVDAVGFSTADCCTTLGNNVAMDGDRMAYASDINIAGYSKVYVRTPTGWLKEASMDASGNVDLRDDLFVLATNPGPFWGAPSTIRVYQRTGSTWNFSSNVITLPNGFYPVKLDEEHVLAVGDPKDDDAGTNAGAVYLFRRQGTAWVLWEKLLSPEFPASAGFGTSIAFEDDTLVVGSAGDDDAASNAGSVYVFRRNGGWNQVLELHAPDAAADDRFGTDVAIDGDSLLVGARDDDDAGTDTGSAYVFRLASEATVYCTAKVNSLGCLPEIDFVGTPSVSSASPFTISVRNVLSNKLGVFYYGISGRGSTPFDGGIRCVSGNVKRTGMFLSGGNFPPTDCSGVNSIDFNARIQSGIDPNLVASTQVNGQFWTRDGGVASGTGLSDGIEFKIQP